MAGLLAALHDDGGLAARAPAPTPGNVARWLAFASAAAALTCIRRGADPPMRGDVEKLLADPRQRP